LASRDKIERCEKEKNHKMNGGWRILQREAGQYFLSAGDDGDEMDEGEGDFYLYWGVT
jgi:hypothetical protein